MTQRQTNSSTISSIAQKEAQTTTILICKLGYVVVWIYVELDVDA
jgi:hypothetical protein